MNTTEHIVVPALQPLLKLNKRQMTALRTELGVFEVLTLILWEAERIDSFFAAPHSGPHLQARRGGRRARVAQVGFGRHQ